MKNVLFLMMALTLVSAPALMCEPIKTDAPAYQSKGTVMVPMRAIFEWLGAEVSFDSATGGITAKRGEQVVSLKAGSKTATVNGETKTMSAESRNGRTFVPVRFVAEAFGAEVGWDAGSRRVFITDGTREGTLLIPVIKPERTKDVTIGAFAVSVPTDWKHFNSSEAAELRQQYVAQSKEIYQQYSASMDSSETVDFAAFHFSNGAGTFIVVSFTVPPQSDLITMLKSQAKDKADWGIREGYIRKYLGLTPVNIEQLSGFYVKMIGKDGGIMVSGGLEHSKLQNTIIQLTLLCPKTWTTTKATETLSDVLKSVNLKQM